MKTSKRVIFLTLAITLAFVGIFEIYYMKKQEANSKVVRVGYIYVGDRSTTYTENFIKAQEAVEQTYGNRVESVAFYNVSESSIAELYEEVIKADLDIVFSTSYGYQDEVKRWAKENPDIEFCQATGINANTDPLPNYHNFMGTIYEGRYITGVVAGAKLKELIEEGKLKPEDAKVGYVGAYPFAEVISGYTAFLLGVRSQVENATMEVVYSDTWSDYALEKQMAEELIDRGCVIISQHSDTMGTAVACQELTGERPLIQVGYNTSMIDVAPTTSLVSSKINWELYETQVVGAVLADKPIEKSVDAHVQGKDAWGGLKEGWVEIVGLNEFIVSDDMKELVTKTIDGLNDGSIQVFSGDYTATNPEDPTDKIDLSKEPYVENEYCSAPTFSYILDDVIKVITL